MSAKEKFADLKAEVIKYASLIEEMVDKSLTTFLERKKELAESVIEYDERQADLWENKLEEACISFIALYQPEAKILRYTMMIYKMASDLERIGDIAANIAKDAATLCDYPVGFSLESYEKMKQLNIQMFRQAIESLVEENSSLAINIIKTDKEVNALRDTTNAEIIRRMNEQKGDVLPWILLLSVSRHLEKIADIITNIAAAVIYISEGKVVKHQQQ